MSPVFPLTLALYAVSCALYMAHAATSADRLARSARLVLAGAFLSHAADIGALCLHGIHPFVDGREALSFIAWLTVGAYLGVTLRHPLPLVGALLVPITMVLHVAARLAPSGTSGPQASTLLRLLHIGLATAGVAVFAVAGVGALIYLGAETQLKRHRFGALFRQGPPLATLDALNQTCILLGFPLFTIAMITGAIWVMRLPDGGVHRLLAPRYALSAIAWGLFATLLLARRLGGWRGRRAALLTLAGLGAALCVVAIYFLRGPI